MLDIAPTVLHLLGVPVPADMDGRILTELLDPVAAPPPPGAIPIVHAGAALPVLAGGLGRKR